MKRNLLVASAIVVSGGLFAQSTQLDPSYDVKAPNKVVNEGELSFQATSNFGGVKPNTPNNKAVSIVPMGNSGNAYTCGFGPKTYLWADPNLNAVTFSHRTDPNTTGDGSTGWIRFDVSNDGGTTWTANVGPVYNASTPYSNARYPQGLIYNPANNTDVANAFFTYFAPTLNGTNSSWGGYGYGVSKLDGTGITQHEDSSTASMFKLIPSSFFVTQNGVLWNVDVEGDGLNNYEYTDSLILSTGIISGNDVSYIYNKLYAPSSLDNTGAHNMVDAVMAFAPDGLTGYIAIIGHNDYNVQPDSAYYLYTYKTTDGGGSWSGPTNILPSNLAGVTNALGAGAYTTGFELDLAVDGNGNPHIVCAIGPQATGAGWSINTTPGAWGLFDVTSTDGGTTWDAKLIAKPMTFRGTFGDPNGNAISEDSRAQVGINWTGDKVFYTYFDTDTNIFGTQDGNLYPDAWIAGLDLATGNMAAPQNVTTGTAADGIATFGNMSYYVFDDGNGNYTIPISFQQLTATSDVLSPTQHQYVSGVVLTDADFTSSIASIEDNANINLYPNPSNGIITLNVDGSTYSYEVMDITGKVVINNTVASASRSVIDMTKYPSGVYFVKVNTAAGSFMQKVILSK
ncbi:MAG TPA: hypothetical protein DIU39_01900 [Flavobacteriales bacterium]|nr:hypothetical protein [Flavobacteriales bacterium]|tara:strand:+ start:59524 stop:61395 length:1872 start_codon:yes stop_codon:yes gene_type:complete